MKSFIPWFCLVAATAANTVQAADGVDAYRRGNYFLAAKSFAEGTSKDPVVNYYLGRMRLYGYGELKNNALALRYFTEAAQKGYMPAQEFLARYYLQKGNDPVQAFQWFKKLADADETAAQMYCAAAYIYGYGVKQNADMGRRYFIEAAKNGNPIAQFAVASQFLDSRDSRNKKLGLIWLSKAAEQNNPKALVKLGELYAAGGIVNRDPVKAKQLMEQAVSQNYIPAMVALGELAQKQNNFFEAKEWFNKAAEANNVDAQLDLAKMYLSSTNSQQDASSGFMWMLKAAQNGSGEAQKLLSEMYKKGQGVAVDENLALQWKQTAEASAAKKVQVDPRVATARWLSNDSSDKFGGNYQLGGIYSAWQNPQALKENNYNAAPQMDTVTRNHLYQPQFVMAKPDEIPINDYFDVLAPMLTGAHANDWSFPRYPIDKQIASLIRHDSMVLKHKQGSAAVDDGANYLQKDDEEDSPDYLAQQTLGWKQQANMQAVLSEMYNQAILGNSSSQFEIGQLYQYGIGVVKNIDQAIVYYQLAAAQQDVRAEYNLGVMYLEGKTNPVDYQKGIDWMTDAAFKGNAYAQYVLANIYEKGLSDPNGKEIIKPNHQQAMAMYYLASANHFGEAEYRLADYLVKEKQSGLSQVAKKHRSELIKRLYAGAAKQGVAEAILPLAFYNAMDSDPKKQAQAFEIARKEARNGNSEAALLLGIMFDRGISVQPNQYEALYWYQQAANNPVSAFILGTYFTEGNGVAKDLEKGRALLQQSADAGFPYANLNLGVLKHDVDEYFLTELDTARQQGNSKAGLLLADYYLQQANDPEKMKQARDIYEYFAGKGDKEAQTKLAFLYDRGLGGEANSEVAAHWYTEAAEQGQPIAQFLLAQLYQLGRVGDKPDYELAKKWYKQAQVNFPFASVALGFIYDTVEDDYVNAADNYSLAAKTGDAIGQYNLGLLYENGKGMPVNLQQARDYFQQAADQGYGKAMTQLAGLYFNGIDGVRDEQQALHWYKKAAAAGDGGALYQLGLLSETGVAMKLDFPNAVSYYQQASDLGNEKAQMALARMYQYGIGVQKDLQHAADLYKVLAANSNAYAQYQLAMMYIDGQLGEPSIAQGKPLLIQASNNGSYQAETMLRWLNAKQEQKLSFIEPMRLNKAPVLAGQPAELMYMDALNEWNRGDETMSRMILDRLMTQFPHYIPAKKIYEQLNQQSKAPDLG
ncbi:enhanced entry protein EnhC [Legionella birminghamensis]|uniref:Enhanced entry protein EnhC n=1 Tax=Legionella birminghamensis TaxID=28083 RepID=A0A378ICP9_9GAMM|nr:tetratricopeptide repeat protein [Legionella birminghamensis]KTC74282.1 enhanced entry protein EnhC [Legionella birminghamensis]STX32600.1 enhanced entry protein EnhC [Legionella birminghamensis]